MHFIKKLLPTLLFVLLAVTGCSEPEIQETVPPVPPPPPPTAGKVLQSLQLTVNSSTDKKLVLRSGNHTLTLFKESKAGILDGIALQLPDETTVSAANEWEISSRSAEVILLPIMKRRARPIRRILIDPGHGGSDPGTISVHGTAEKQLNLLLAHAVAAELKKVGFSVAMTREKDVFLTLDQRPALIKRCQADLFISLHHNSASNQAAAGLEIFILESRDAKENELASDSVYTAFCLQRKLAPLNMVPGRGVKTARFKVLRLAECPALLIEAGFLSNPPEGAYMATDYYRKKFAEALARELADQNITGANQQKTP